MRYFILTLMGLMTFSFPAFATKKLSDCFTEPQKDNSAISICVTQLYAERKAILEVIEREFEVFIRTDKYLPAPKPYTPPSAAKQQKKATSVSPSNKQVFDPNKDKHSSGSESSLHVDRLDRKIIEMRNNKASKGHSKASDAANERQKKKRYEHEKRLYEIKKQKAINELLDSQAKFHIYMETECKRQTSVHENDDDIFRSDITIKSCYYDMINHRIKTLQRSMSR